MWGNFTCLIIDEILREKQSSVCFDLWNFQEIDLFQCLNEKRSSSGKLSLLHDRLVAEFVLRFPNCRRFTVILLHCHFVPIEESRLATCLHLKERPYFFSIFSSFFNFNFIILLSCNSDQSLCKTVCKFASGWDWVH